MNENHLQAMFDGLSAQFQKERSGTQLTLGGIISALESMQGSTIKCLGKLRSYRGYYCDLAFEPDTEERPISEVLKECHDAMGKTFEGYKGGDYMMGEITPVWSAAYGCLGSKIVGINKDGTLETIEDDY